MLKLLIVISLLIVYGSLYPFGFEIEPVDAAKLYDALSFDPYATSRGDILGNIALFIPFGLAGILSIERPTYITLKLIGIIVLGITLAAAMQIGQFFIPGRVPAVIDVFWNGVGFVIGGLIAALPQVRNLVLVRLPGEGTNIPLFLSIAWFLYQLMPFVPTLDFQEIKNSLKPLFLSPELSLFWVFQNFVAWLVLFHLMSISAATRRYVAYFPLLLLIVFGAQLFIVSNKITLNEILGGSLGLIIWFAGRRKISPPILSSLLLLSIYLVSFYPFELRPDSAIFKWIPFTGFLTGAMEVNALALMKKVYLYGSLIWLLYESGISWRGAIFFVTGALAISESMQIFVINSTPESTDPILAILIGIGLCYLHNSTTKINRSFPSKNKLIVTSQHAVASDRSPDRGKSPVPNQGSSLFFREAPTSIHYMASLDGLRALAALAVFGVHFNQAAGLSGSFGIFDLESFLKHGNTGVCLFFVLSGFLLSIPFWRAHRYPGERVNIKGYTIGRLARIIPAYYVCLTLILIGKGAFGSQVSPNNIISHYLFLYNLKDWNILSLNPPFWTLAVEVQFYLILPLVFAILYRVGYGLAFAIVVLLVIGPYLANYLLMTHLLVRNIWPIEFDLVWPFAVQISDPNSFVLKYSTLAHLTYFFIGVATSWFLLSIRNQGFWRQPRIILISEGVFWVSSISVFLIISTALFDIIQMPFGRYNWPVVPLLLALTVLTAPHALIARSILESFILRGLGIVSYGIYIYHYPVQKVVARVMSEIQLDVQQAWLIFGGVSLVLTILISIASYVWIEKPIMQRVKGIRRSKQEDRTTPISAKRTTPISAKRTTPISAKSETSYSRLPKEDRGRHVQWTRASIRFSSDQGRLLKKLSDQRKMSVSRFARGVLAKFMNNSNDLITAFVQRLKQGREASAGLRQSRPQHFEVNLVDANLAGERGMNHNINLHVEQLEFLNWLSRETDISVSQVFRIIIEDFIKLQQSPNP